VLERGSYVQTSLNHVTPSVPPNLTGISRTSSNQKRYAQVKSVGPSYDGVICTGRRRSILWRDLVFGVWQKHLPATSRGLQRVEIEGDEIVEEEAFDLAAENVNL
jgi:hypothetical protein